jgi:hypothetical protein
VPVVRACRSTILADADQDDAAMPVREANDRVRELLVGEGRVGFGNELGGELFTTREETA